MKTKHEASEPGHGFGPEFMLLLESVDVEFDEWDGRELDYLEETPQRFLNEHRKMNHYENT